MSQGKRRSCLAEGILPEHLGTRVPRFTEVAGLGAGTAEQVPTPVLKALPVSMKPRQLRCRYKRENSAHAALLLLQRGRGDLSHGHMSTEYRSSVGLVASTEPRASATDHLQQCTSPRLCDIAFARPTWAGGLSVNWAATRLSYNRQRHSNYDPLRRSVLSSAALTLRWAGHQVALV